MSFSRNPNVYTDVVSVLTAARKAGGAIYTLPTAKAAVQWRARAYHYRSLLLNIARQRTGQPPGWFPSTEWDDLVLSHDPGSCVVRISFMEALGQLSTPEGEAIDIPVVKPQGGAELIVSRPLPSAPAAQSDEIDLSDASLLDEAEELRKKLGL